MIVTMAHDKETGREKNVTAATTDAPQEEFISPTNVPSVPENQAKQQEKPREGEGEPPRH